jgi:hypothetical protein
MKRFLGLLVFMFFFFSACAPAVPGSSRYSPIDAQKSGSASISAGPEWFVKTSGPARLVSLKTRNASLNSLFSSNSDVTVGKIKSQNVNWLRIQDLKASAGWVVELVSQEGFREIADVDPDGGYSFFDSMALT